MTTRFLLLRHAESTHPHVFNGYESDVGLSPRGERQAIAVAPILAAFAPAAVVSSPMLRAVQTARPIAAACHLDVRIEHDLHESRLGILSGKTDAETGGVWAETVRRWRRGELDHAPEGGESFLAVQGRVLPVWERIAAEYAGTTVVVVAHGHVCRALLLSLLPGKSMASWEEFRVIRNVGITELVREADGWRMLRFSEVPAGVEP